MVRVCVSGYGSGRASRRVRVGAAIAGALLLGGAMVGARSGSADELPIVGHALAEYSVPRHAEGFSHFSYANPAAPKGGRLVLAETGSFDSLNPIILRGVAPETIGLTFDTLMVESGEELDVVYGLIAERVAVAADRSEAVFHLRPQARFHDGHPITADDFVFAWEAVSAHGQPFLRAFLADLESLEAPAPDRLRARFKTRGDARPLMNLATTLVPQPRHWWTEPGAGRDIARTTLDPILGSGPYRITAVDPGRSLTYRRVEDYWAGGLGVRAGQYNFDEVRVDYYRDDDVKFEAFKAGTYDFHRENRAQRWTTGYDLPQVAEGRLATRALALEMPLGAQGFRFNTRRSRFADARVREAFDQLFDFEWTRANLLNGQYKRIASNFPNSDFGADGPPTAAERAVLERYRGRIPDRALTEAYRPAVSDGSGSIRAGLRTAVRLFGEAGWELRGGRLTHTASGEVMTVEFLTNSQGIGRLVLPYIRNLERAGITGTLRLVDNAQYKERVDASDFDVMIANVNFYPPPGPELRSYFGSAAARQKGSANYPGIADPAVDDLIEEILAADSLEQSKLLTRCLDRVLVWGFYMVPHWYNDQIWLAYWNRFGWPDRNATYVRDFLNSGFPATWWYDPGRAAAAGLEGTP